MDKKTSFNLYLNGNPFYTKKVFISQLLPKTLSELRVEFSNIPNDANFLNKESFIIETQDEEDYTLEEVVKENTIYLKSKLDKMMDLKINSSLPPKVKNVPLKNSKYLKDVDGLKIYLYPTYISSVYRQIEKKGNQETYTINHKELNKEFKLREDQELTSIVLMVVGQTGSGKTTFLNSFINYIMGIDIDDDFRYFIIQEDTQKNQAHSQTENVTVYHIQPHQDFPSIIIVDTPGFGDTRGIDLDKVITELISFAFSKLITSINAVCFVAQSSNARLTANQKYIFNKVMELFGKDIAENFIAALTFCDGKEPQIVAALQEKGSIFDEIIPLIKSPWYLKFNNSSIFSNSNDEFSRMFWKLGMDSFKSFMDKLTRLPQKSLCLSKDVLNERKRLENTILRLQPLLTQGLNSMESIRQLLKVIETNQIQINSTKDFKTTVQTPKIEKVDLSPGVHTTTCINCNFTCHNGCAYSNNAEKANCCAMSNGYCTVCPNRCHWERHSNLPYIFKYYTVSEVVTQKELEAKFYDATNSKLKSVQILEGLEKEFEDISIKCLETQETIRNSIVMLKKIALNSNTFESSEEYIDLMIISEEDEKKPFWQDRVKSLKELKKQHGLIRQAYDGKSIVQDFEQFKRDLITKYKTENKKDSNSKCVIF
jgi:hypothetical protein